MRDVGNGREQLAARLPAVVSFVGAGTEPRYPTVKDLLAARKRIVERVTCADLGLRPVEPSTRERVVRLVATPIAEKKALVMSADDGVEHLISIWKGQGR
jgi:electron transfer flavoprotein alpha/beta subunit